MSYARFCESRFGKVLDCPASLLEDDKDFGRAARKRGKQLWEERHCAEPFHPCLKTLASEAPIGTQATEAQARSSGDDAALIADLTAAVERQSSFYFQVSEALHGSF